LPLAFMHIDTHLGSAGAFRPERPPRRLPSWRATLNALVLVPTVIIDFAQLESSGNSRFATSAEANAIPKVGLGAGTMVVGMIGQDFKIGFGASDARFSRLNTPFFVDGEFGGVKSVDSFDNVALANSLTSLTGTQGTQYRYDKRWSRPMRRNMRRRCCRSAPPSTRPLSTASNPKLESHGG
jgi:hypothetical protein